MKKLILIIADQVEFIAVPYTDYYIRFQFSNQERKKMAMAAFRTSFLLVRDEQSARAWMQKVTAYNKVWNYSAVIIHHSDLPSDLRVKEFLRKINHK